MLIVRVLFKVKPDGLDALHAHIREDVPQATERAGNHAYTFRPSPEDPLSWLLYEEWEDAAAFEAYKRSDLFARASATLFPLMDGKPSSAYYEAERVGP